MVWGGLAGGTGWEEKILADAVLKRFETLRPSNDLGTAPSGNQGDENIFEDAVLKKKQRPSDGLGQASRVNQVEKRISLSPR